MWPTGVDKGKEWRPRYAVVPRQQAHVIHPLSVPVGPLFLRVVAIEACRGLLRLATHRPVSVACVQYETLSVRHSNLRCLRAPPCAGALHVP
jgi:hypothetical protein